MRYSRLAAWVCVAACVAVAYPSGVSHAQFMWQTKAPLLDPRTFSGVEGAGASLIAGKIYVSHGYRFGDSFLLSIYDIASDSWTHGGPSAPNAVTPRSEMGAGTALGKHYAIGGRTGPTAAVEEFDPAGPSWTTMTSLPFPRGGLGCASAGNKIYAIGGRSGATFGSGVIFGNNDVFDPAVGVGGTWSPLAPLPIAVSDNYATIAYLGKIYVFGGVDAFGTVITKVQIYDIASNTWGFGNDVPTARADAMAGVLCPGTSIARIAVFGGYNGSSNLSVTELYDPATDTWAPGPPMPSPVSEVAQGMTWDASGVYSIGTGIFGPSGTDLYRLVRTTPCNRPPQCDAAMALVENLWPPNHKYTAVTIVGVTDPDGDPVTIVATGITQDEPLNTVGDGNTCPDGQIDGDGVAHVRMERSGTPAVPGNGRVYHVSFTATDDEGESCDGVVTVCVPHDQGNGSVCVDDGPLYNSLGPCKKGSHSNGDPVAATDLTVRTNGRRSVLEYSLAEEADVNLSVFDLAGRRVATIENTRKGAGSYTVTWEGALTRGVYFYRLRAGSVNIARTVLHAD